MTLPLIFFLVIGQNLTKFGHSVLGTTMRTVVAGDLKQQLSKKAPCRPYYIENGTLSTLFAYTLRDLSTHMIFSYILRYLPTYRILKQPGL